MKCYKNETYLATKLVIFLNCTTVRQSLSTSRIYKRIKVHVVLQKYYSINIKICFILFIYKPIKKI